MKFKSFLFLILFSSLLFGQYQRIVLLEEATNTACPDCAVLTPQVQNFAARHFGTEVMIEYHAWWPSASDPMYVANTAGNEARISYYGFYYVPIYALDGRTIGEPVSTDEINYYMNKRSQEPAPVWIHVEHTIANNKFIARGYVKCGKTLESSTMRLRIAIIEREIKLSGSGENIFTNVFRKFLPDAAGTPITITVNDSIPFELSTSLQSEWNPEELAAVAMVQDNSTKEILQANVSIPTFRIKTLDGSGDILAADTTIIKHYRIYNPNLDTLHVVVKPLIHSNPNEWKCSLLFDNANYDSVSIAIPPEDSLDFGFEIKTNDSDGEIKAEIFARDTKDKHGWGNSVSYYGLELKNKILVVDNDGGGKMESFIVNALNSFKDFGVEYFLLDHKYLELLTTDKTSFDFPAVFWNVANYSPAVDSNDVAFLKNYLDGGGKLFICGQNVGSDIFEANGKANFQAAKDFYHIYLDADYLEGNHSSYLIGGLENTQFTGINFSLNTVYERAPDAVKSFDEHGKEIFVFKDDSSKFAGVCHDAENYKTVYLTFGIEQIIPRANQKKIVQQVLATFGYIVEKAEDNATMPASFKLFSNYPNPFGTQTRSGKCETEIKYSLPTTQFTTLSVYDVLGRKVATLINKTQQAGVHSVRFNAIDLPSGIYFYRLQAGNNFIQTKKMVLIK